MKRTFSSCFEQKEKATAGSGISPQVKLILAVLAVRGPETQHVLQTETDWTCWFFNENGIALAAIV